MNLMTNVVMFLQEERIYNVKRDEYGFKLSTCTKEGKIVWIKGVLQILTKSGNMVLDTCAGTFPVSRAHLVLPEDRKLIGYKVDPS